MAIIYASVISLKLERELSQSQTRIAAQPVPSNIPSDTCDGKAEINKLKEENKKLAEQLEVYELRKEQMHIQVSSVCSKSMN